MAAGTFATEVLLEGGRWYYWVEVDGWGRRNAATVIGDKRDRYKFGTLDPVDHGLTTTSAGQFIPCLATPPEFVAEHLDIRTGETTLGPFSFELMDMGPRSTSEGWASTDIVTQLLAVADQGTNGPFTLSTDLAKAGTSLVLTSATGVVADDILHIGAEAVRVSSIAGAPTLTVVRGVLGTNDVEHKTRANGGEGIVYDRPTFVKGRRVTVYAQVFGTRTEKSLSVATGVVIGQGVIDDWDMVNENVFRFECRPLLGSLDREIGTKQYRTRMSMLEQRDEASVIRSNGRMTRDVAQRVIVQVPQQVFPGDPVAEPQYAFSGAGDAAKQTFYARFGDQIVQAEYVRNTNDPAHGNMDIIAWGLRPIHLVKDRPGDTEKVFHDILITNPKPRRIDPDDHINTDFQIGGVSAIHPVDIMLALITSTGAGTNGDWDNLAAHWGAGMAVGLINLVTFRNVKARTAGIAMPSLIIGWDGQPVVLRQWLEDNILRPLGFFLYHDANGALALGEVSEVYETAALPTIKDEDVAAFGRPRMAGQLDRTTARQSFQYGLKRDRTTAPAVSFRSPESERYDFDNNAVKGFVSGFMGADALPVLMRRITQFARLWSTPLPLVQLTTSMHRISLDVSDPVMLTLSNMPNPTTGTRGLTDVAGVIIGRAPKPSTNTIEWDIVLVPDTQNGRWASSGKVQSWNAGSLELTLETNEFSKANAGDGLAATDAADFTIGDQCMHLDSDLQVKSATLLNVDNIVGDVITLDQAPASVPIAGDYLTYCHFSTSGATPNAAWTATMVARVAEANDADDLFPDGSSPYRYGM